MIKFAGLFLMCLILTGCLTTQSLQQKIQTINFTDGVDTEEAVLLAKQELLDSSSASKYKTGSPEVLRDYFVRQYSDHWFIQFPARKFDDSFWKYLVVVHRETGKINYAGEYVQMEVVDYDWVFDPSQRRFER